MSSMENSQDDALRQPNSDTDNNHTHTNQLSDNCSSDSSNSDNSINSHCSRNEDSQQNQVTPKLKDENSSNQLFKKGSAHNSMTISTISHKLYAPFNTPLKPLEYVPFYSANNSANEDTRTKSRNNKSNLVDIRAAKQGAKDYNLSSPQAAVTHPNFDDKKTPIDPAQPLSKTPSLETQYERYLQQLLNPSFVFDKIGEQALPDVAHTTNELAVEQMLNRLNVVQPNLHNASKWALIASPELAAHLEFLYHGGLIDFPDSFFEPVKDNDSAQSVAPTQQNTNTTNNALLQPLTQLRLLDLADIYAVIQQYPNLTRYGFDTGNDGKEVNSENDSRRVTNQTGSNNHRHYSAELINDAFAPTWEVILQPEHFDNGVDSLNTDILACSVAVHILKQCPTRKTINRTLTTSQMCQHMRSYILSQCNVSPQLETQYRQIRLFEGHVIMAATYLGLQISHKQSNKNEPEATYLNVSSRGALFNRYPYISQYYVNGWQ